VVRWLYFRSFSLFFSLVHKLRLSRPLASYELELELIQTQMAQKPMLLAEVCARALRASHNVKGTEVWVGARCAWWVGGAWAIARVEGTRFFALAVCTV
jgi:hypothetical protein